MQNIVNYVQRIVKGNEAPIAAQPNVECNFGNNYYGDQACVPRKSP